MGGRGYQGTERWYEDAGLTFSANTVSRFWSSGQYDEAVGDCDWKVFEDLGVLNRRQAGGVEVSNCFQMLG
jgi:hypothetical protein